MNRFELPTKQDNNRNIFKQDIHIQKMHRSHIPRTLVLFQRTNIASPEIRGSGSNHSPTVMKKPKYVGRMKKTICNTSY